MESPRLVRAIGRWSLVALTVNCIIGSSVFGLPPQIAALVGRQSPWAVLVAGLLVGVIMACFAEVASYFSDAGGPYLYGRTAFGPLIGIQTGWMFWLAQLTAPAANANLFVIYLAEFWPAAVHPLMRLAILTFLIGLLALLNYRGLQTGIRISNIFTVAKLLPLAVVILGGLASLARSHPPQPVLVASSGGWLTALQILVFFYGGFETALTPMAEARNPRRDPAVALLVALVVCMVVYSLIQWVVIAILPDPIHSQRPLAELAGITLARGGAAFVALGALATLYGYLSAKILTVPRITFALAEHGDFPRFFAAIHPRFRTPHVSIAVFAVLTWLLAVFGSFAWNVTLSAVARLFYYGVGCAALIALRRSRPGEALFRLPAGPIFAAVGIAICLVLFLAVKRTNLWIVGLTVTLALANWWWVRRRGTHSAAAPQQDSCA
jgi:APA family basic amino acid/polyamine antiporter